MEDPNPEAAADPALFYTGLVAELYRTLRSSHPDPDPYARFIERSGQPALELGCGDGDPILALRTLGFDVEGLDSSDEMLARCRARADDAGISVVLHHQRMETFDVGRRFRTIYLAGATFNLLPDDDAALRALVCVREHLDIGGAALIPLFIPEVVDQEEVGHVREAVAPDGETVRFSLTAVHRDDVRRRQETTTRYERIAAERTIVERPWIVHWHTKEGFRALATQAGLSTVAVLDAAGKPATPSSKTFVFWLQHGDPDGPPGTPMA